MAGTFVKIVVAVGSIVIGVGLTWFYHTVVPSTSQNTLILLGIVMVLASYVSLYFMTKGSGSG
jgi:hypothetical protein